MVSVLLLVFGFLGLCLVCRRWPTALLEVVPGRGAVRACTCWACYKPAMPFLLVVAMPVLCSPGARHLRACPRDRLLPLLGTPIPTRLCQRELLWAASVLELRTRSGRGKQCGQRLLSFVELS
ncbi:hypothetical protein Taro_005892 [Colocasia esculenta]|uniref:Uncharacterized protein n=1 Tax=Colocasia esculenta TaxID=4460 RepID=A0A843TVL8_COLES|nr:hypothetical protein [Colocasia esculenta]